MKPIAWWHWLPLRRTWRVVSVVDAGDQVPERLPSRGVVLVGSRQRPTWAAFDCPCDTDHRLMINLDPARRPTWHIEATRRFTLRPSVDDVTNSRRCHFFIRNGKVIWAHRLQRNA
ncbi:MAG: hypothetical protein QOI61_2020 [Actinomycetota bacterium]|jgi:hypothetical protein